MLEPRRALAQALLPRYAAARLPSALRRWVSGRIAADAALAATYDAMRRAERAAAQGAPLSSGQRDLIEGALFDALGQEASVERAGRRVPLWQGAVAVGALAVLFVLARPPKSDDNPFGVGDLAARGAAMQQHPLGVKVACVVGDAVVDSASAGARDSGDTLRCAKGGLLAFSTTNLDDQTRHVFVVGIARDGARRWYAPFDKGSGSVAMPAGQVDALLPTLADTSSMPDDDVALFVLLSDQPFSADDVERQLAASERHGVPLGRLDRLPVGVPLQGRLQLVRASR